MSTHELNPQICNQPGCSCLSSRYRATNRGHQLGDVLSAALAINLVLDVFALVFFLVATHWLVTTVLSIAPEFQREARISFYLTGATLLFMLVSQVFSSVPQALHRFDHYATVTVVTTLSLQTGNVACTRFG